jgi:hypothetical protein
MKCGGGVVKTAVAALAISVLLFPSTSMASNRLYAFYNIWKGSPIHLEMDQFKVRVDGWSKDYVEVQLCLSPKSPVVISSRNNRVRLRIDEFGAPYWEPAIRVRVPEGLPVDLKAGSDAWVCGCKVSRITARRIFVKCCQLPKTISARNFGFGFLNRRLGWQWIVGVD